MSEFGARNTWGTEAAQRLGPSGSTGLAGTEIRARVNDQDNPCQINLLPGPGLHPGKGKETQRGAWGMDGIVITPPLCD